MKEIDYEICQVIKKFKLEKNKNPNINNIARRIYLSRNGTRYHLNKLMDLGIVAKNEKEKTYYLIVSNLK